MTSGLSSMGCDYCHNSIRFASTFIFESFSGRAIVYSRVILYLDCIILQPCTGQIHVHVRVASESACIWRFGQ